MRCYWKRMGGMVLLFAIGIVALFLIFAPLIYGGRKLWQLCTSRTADGEQNAHSHVGL